MVKKIKGENLDKKIKYFSRIFKKGLEDQKSVFDIFLHLSMNDLRFLQNESESNTVGAVIVFLVIFITSFPDKTLTFKSESEENEYLAERASSLRLLASLASLQKVGLILCEFPDMPEDRFNPNVEYKITPYSTPCKELVEKYGDK